MFASSVVQFIRFWSVLMCAVLLLQLPVSSAEHNKQTKSMPNCSIVSLMTDYWKFWQREEAASDQDKARLFLEVVINPNRAVYQEAFRGYFDSVETGSRIPKYLKKTKLLLTDMETLCAIWPQELEKCSERFLHEFPDMEAFTIYIMPSLFTFNGKTGKVDGRMCMFIGIDWFAQNKCNLEVLVDHELFHVYHAQVAPELFSEVATMPDKEMPLYKALWTEGLATYVSKVLNPNASMGDILMDDTLSFRGNPKIAACAKEILGSIDSTSKADYAKFFKYRADTADGEYPSRIGYQAGLSVVERIAGNYSLSELAHLQGLELKTKIQEALGCIVSDDHTRDNKLN